MTNAEAPASQLYRVTYTTSGLQRRTKTVDAETLNYLQGAWYNGMRVTSYRKATEAEVKRGVQQATNY